MVRLGQKFKMSKNMRKTIPQEHYKTLEVFCAKNRQKKHQIFEKCDNFENGPSCKGYSLCKMVGLGRKLKMQKKCEKLFYKNIRVVLCKNPLEKTPNIREMRQF